MRTSITKTFFLLAGWSLPIMVSAETSKLPNPITTTDPAELIGRMIRSVLGIVGGIGLIMFIYGGFMFLISSGNAERVQKGKETLMWATLGLLVVFGSYGLVEAVFKIIFGKSLLPS